MEESMERSPEPGGGTPTGTPTTPTPGSHRSRKEKLVVRSFSTDHEGPPFEDHIHHHHPFPSPTHRGRGVAQAKKVRRTASAPAPTNGDNDHNPDEEGGVLDTPETKGVSGEETTPPVGGPLPPRVEEGKKGAVARRKKGAGEASPRRRPTTVRKPGGVGGVRRRPLPQQQQRKRPHPQGGPHPPGQLPPPHKRVRPPSVILLPKPPPLVVRAPKKRTTPPVTPTGGGGRRLVTYTLPPPFSTWGGKKTTPEQQGLKGEEESFVPPPPPPPDPHEEVAAAEGGVVPEETLPTTPLAAQEGEESIALEEASTLADAYAQGFAALQRLCAQNSDRDQNQTTTVTLSDICMEVVAKLSGLLAPNACIFDSDESDEDDQIIAPFTQEGRRLLRQSRQKRKRGRSQGAEGEDEEEENVGDGPLAKWMLGAYTTAPTPSDPSHLLTNEELELFQELVALEEDGNKEEGGFKCWEEEQEAAALYCHIVRSQLAAQRRREARREESAGVGVGGGAVVAMALPVNLSDFKGEDAPPFDPSLIVSIPQFVEKLRGGGGGALGELGIRTLRNGKRVPLKRIKLRSTIKPPPPPPKISTDDKKGEDVDGDVEGVGGVSPQEDGVKLRSGKLLEKNHSHSDTNSMFVLAVPPPPPAKTTPTATTTGLDDVLSTNTIKTDEYSEGVEGTIEGGIPPTPTLEEGESVTTPPGPILGFLGTNERCRTQSLNVKGPSSGGMEADLNFFFGATPPMFSPQAQPHPLQPPPGLHPPTTPPSSSPSTSTLVKSRYSRRKHSQQFPPFENNHCSYPTHHCPLPRAPNSRFCLQHVDEGATLNFGRCRYVKGARECGLFIPRASSQTLFCDIHALKIANARQRLSRPPKPFSGRTSSLLRNLRCNLDRAQGKIMERDDTGFGPSFGATPNTSTAAGGGGGGYLVRKDLLEDERETLNNASSSSEEEEGEVEDGDSAEEEDDDDDDVEVEGRGVSGDEPDWGALRNAGYYTVDECVRMYREALLGAKAGLEEYLGLLGRSHAIKRRAYLREVERLRASRIPFTTDPALLSTRAGVSTPYLNRQVRVHNETNAILNHRRDRGARALLRRQALTRRTALFMAEASGGSPGALFSPEPIHPKETEVEAALRVKRALTQRHASAAPTNCMEEGCKERPLPLAQFCRTHILQEPNQTMYKACSWVGGCGAGIWRGEGGCALHALPLLPKEGMVEEGGRGRVEEALETILTNQWEEEGEEEAPQQSEEAAKQAEVGMVLEMEELVGDEVVDLDHFRETVTSLYAKGIYLSDSEEESEDTEEEGEGEESPPQQEPHPLTV